MKLIDYMTEPDDLILDFFSGSSTTAHAVIELNEQEKFNRKFILIQLPEPTYSVIDGKEVPKKGVSGEAYKAGYKTIAEIGKDRIRRVIKKLNEEKPKINNAKSHGRGFKVLKLDKSNFKQWQKIKPSVSIEDLEKQLEWHVDHVSHVATPEDLLYEILLKAGFTPTSKIEIKIIADKNVYSVNDGALLLCLEDEITKEVIDAVVDIEPMQFICLDSAFHGNDQLKANAVQTFKAYNMAQEKLNPATGKMEKQKHNQILFRTV
jgi:adenine-specific DNA-methyltransferase